MIIVYITLVILILLLTTQRRRKKRKKILLGLESILSTFKNPFEQSITQAKERLRIKEYNIAVSITDQILEVQPQNLEALLLRAACLEAINYNLEAIEDFELANSIKEMDANYIGLLGLTYKKIGSFEKGQKYLKRSIERGSNRYEANYYANQQASPLAIELYKSERSVSENLFRRNKIDFVKYLKESDKNDLIKGIKKHIHNLEIGIKSYRKDDEYLRLYEKSLYNLKKLEQNCF